jgi:hypothetical protein
MASTFHLSPHAIECLAVMLLLALVPVFKDQFEVLVLVALVLIFCTCPLGLVHGLVLVLPGILCKISRFFAYIAHIFMTPPICN